VRLIAYTRISKIGERDVEDVISHELQKERIDLYASAHEHEIVDWKKDTDVSGATMERPALKEVFELIEEGEAEGLIVARLDRFGRTVSGALKATESLKEIGGTLVAVDVALDPTTPAGELMFNLLLVLGQFQLRGIGEAWVAARRRRILSGRHIVNRPPAGYRRGEDGRLELDSSAPIIREVFLQRAAGASYGSLAAYLDRELPRENRGAWPIRTVAQMLPRRVYLGEAYSDPDVVPNAHPAIVTEEEFEAAQQQRKWQRAGDAETTALLAGFVRCQGCDHAMIRSGDGRGYAVYKCRRRHSDKICPAPATISDRKLERIVRDAFREQHDRYLLLLARGKVGELYDAAVAAVEAAEEELTAWRDSGLITEIGKEAFLAGYQTRQAALEEAQAELAKTPKALDRPIKAAADRLDDPEILREVLGEYLDVIHVERRVARDRTPAVEIIWKPSFAA
jgi:site-specific DNA recombinase